MVSVGISHASAVRNGGRAIRCARGVGPPARVGGWRM